MAETSSRAGRVAREHDRNRGLDLLRATEAAAIAAGRWLGRGDRAGTLAAAEQVMGESLGDGAWHARVVLGTETVNGSLNPGRILGYGRDAFDLAVVPVDGVSLVAKGSSHALSVAVLTEPGGLLSPPPIAYFHKIAVGPGAVGAIDIRDTPENNLRRVAFATDRSVTDLTVIMLDRPRHQPLMERIRLLGARITLVSDGDVGAAMLAAWLSTGIDVFIGAGGPKEAVVAASAIRCMGGDMQCRPWVRHTEEEALMRSIGCDPESVFTLDDLVPGKDVSVAVTGISGGGVLRGVQYHTGWSESHSLVMRSRTGTVREVQTRHHLGRPTDRGTHGDHV